MRWIGQNIYDKVSKFRNAVDFSKDVTFYQPVNNADPKVSIGSSDDERMMFTCLYQGTGSQTAQINSFRSFTESSTAHDGRFEFNVDETHILKIQDGGIDFYAGKGIGINGVDILTDNGSGTATLSNIDALDATTISTLNAALTAGDITGVTAGTNLSGGGASGAVTINLADASTSAKGAASFSSDNFAASSGAITIKDGGIDLTAEVTGVLPSANMDADTAHLAGIQTFTGENTFALPITSDGNRTLPPGDGAAIHIDQHDVVDSTTSASGTAAKFAHVNIEKPRLQSTNSSVTITDAATLYISGPPLASTNTTITNGYALWVDSGNARFDGNIDLEGDIDVNGTLETDALTIAGATIAAIGTTSITTLGTIGTGVWEGTAIASDQQKHLMHYQFLGYTTGDGSNYEMPQNLTDGQAPFEHADTSSSDGLSIPGTGGDNQRDLIRMGGHLMVNVGTLKKWKGVATNNNNKDLTIGLFKWTPTDNSGGDITPVLLEEVVIAGKGQNKSRTFSTTNFEVSGAVAVGDIIFTQMKTEASGNIGFFNSTLEVEF